MFLLYKIIHRVFVVVAINAIIAQGLNKPGPILLIPF